MYASMYHRDCTLLEKEDMVARWPQAANHDGVWSIFADSHADTVDPVIVSELSTFNAETNESEPLTGDALAWYLAQIMANPANVDVVLWLTRGEASFLHSHPAWRLWCANYTEDDLATYESDWNYVTALIAASMPEASSSWPVFNPLVTPTQGREIIYAAITANTV